MTRKLLIIGNDTAQVHNALDAIVRRSARKIVSEKRVHILKLRLRQLCLRLHGVHQVNSEVHALHNAFVIFRRKKIRRYPGNVFFVFLVLGTA